MSEGAVQTASVGTVQNTSDGGVRILLVDSEHASVTDATREIERAGVRVRAVRVSDEGSMRAAMADQRFDILLCGTPNPPLTAARAMQVGREIDSHIGVVCIATAPVLRGMPTEEARDGHAIDDVERSLTDAVKKRLADRVHQPEHEAPTTTRADAQLKRLRELEALGTITGGVAHDMSSPIQFVATNLHFIQRSWETLAPLIHAHAANSPDSDLAFLASEIPNALAQSLDGMTKLAQLTRTLKEMVISHTTDQQSIDLRRVIDAALVVTHHRWRYSCRVERHDPEDLPEVAGHADQIGQALVHVLLNAAEAIEEIKPVKPGVIVVTTRTENGQVKISVTDNGVGIAASVRPHIFEPFFTTKDPSKSAGQGLVLARAVIEDHHSGVLSVDSAEGIGTTVTLALPASSVTEIAPSIP